MHSICLARLSLFVGLLAAIGGEVQARAQDNPEQTTTRNGLPPIAGPSTYLRGFNAGVTFLGVHDSYSGWYTVATPVLSYSLSQHYSVDGSVSIYPYKLVQDQDSPPPGSQLKLTHGDFSDTLLSFHATFSRDRFVNTSSISMTLPTGSRRDGLGTGRVTFNFDDRLQRYFGNTGFFVDAGAGDAAGFANRLVTEDDSSLGPLGQFQSGVIFQLPRSIAIQSLAYEQLPIGDQKTYMALNMPGMPPLTVPSGRRVYEDNGFNTSLFIPLTPHISLSSSYNRSLRLHLDTAATGIAFVWKGSPIRHRPSLIDRAMREAEQGQMIPLPLKP